MGRERLAAISLRVRRIIRGGPLAGQPLRLGAAAITVYRQHGVLEARVWPLVT
jgi:hypothetical protein